MSMPTPRVAVIHAELERARSEFRQLVQTSSARRSGSGFGWNTVDES
jgi:hypothetical protein